MDEAQKIHEDGFIFVKNRKIRCPVITACCFMLTSLETRCGAHPSSFRTSAIQTIFKVPSICIIMRIISENDDRTTRFACVRPSTVSAMRKTQIVSLAPDALNHRRISWQCKRSKWRILRAMHACIGPNNPHSAQQHVVAPHTYADVLIHRPVVA